MRDARARRGPCLTAVPDRVIAPWHRALSGGRLAAVACGIAVTTSCARDPAPNADLPSASTPLAWRFEAPTRWGDRVRVDHAVSPLNSTARAIRAFTYAPTDTSAAAETLLAIAVYDSAAWREASEGTGSTALAAEQGHVFVATVASKNPYASESRDFKIFDSLRVTLDEARRAFHVVR